MVKTRGNMIEYRLKVSYGLDAKIDNALLQLNKLGLGIKKEKALTFLLLYGAESINNDLRTKFPFGGEVIADALSNIISPKVTKITNEMFTGKKTTSKLARLDDL